MVEYEVRIEKNPYEKIEMTVIATDICHALDLVDIYLKRNMADYEDWEIIDCKFIKRFPLCLIERPSGIEYL
jgi:hypothetical protein